MHFEHRLFGEGNPQGDSWSEKMNVWSTRAIANDQWEARFRRETTQCQEGVLWRAALHVLPRAAPLRQRWEQVVTYEGGIFSAKRQAQC